MRKSMFAILAMTIGSPVAAQSWTGISLEPSAAHVSRGTDVSAQVARIARSIRAGRRDGQLSRAEARHLRGEAAAIDAMADGEAGELDMRASVLGDEVFYDRTTTSAAASQK